jgi:hypothetical protein
MLLDEICKVLSINPEKQNIIETIKKMEKVIKAVRVDDLFLGS